MIVLVYMIIALVVAFLFLQILAWWIMNGKGLEAADELESGFTAKRMTRNARMIDLIYEIGKPDSNGQYSPEKMELWDQLRTLEEQDAILTAQEINMVLEARGR